MIRIAFRLVADAVLVALALFISAGTIAWWRAWMLLADLLVVRIVGAAFAYSVNPSLVRERAGLPIHPDQSLTDRVLLFAVLATGFLGLPIIAGLDVFRWDVLPPPGNLLSTIGILLFTLGWCLKSLALRANAFATGAVRLQTEHVHAVADSGVYRVVRHPFYAADPLIFVGLALWLESSIAALCALVPIALVVLRLQHEERFLRRELPGYDEYIVRVPHRIIPGVW
jgi:protein-S-isoprenylcysteine O-methyltransferase Ste14